MGFNAAFADGSVRFFGRDTSEESIRSMVLRVDKRKRDRPAAVFSVAP
jgi:prepilin-type processing-associated H-X9-DG protein